MKYAMHSELHMCIIVGHLCVVTVLNVTTNNFVMHYVIIIQILYKPNLADTERSHLVGEL